jgi:hypothetical protein
METIKVNKDLREKEIKEFINDFFDQVRENAENGIQETEVHIPKHIYSDALNIIHEKLEESNTDYTWLTMRSSYRNEYGQMIYPKFIDNYFVKTRKLKIL